MTTAPPVPGCPPHEVCTGSRRAARGMRTHLVAGVRSTDFSAVVFLDFICLFSLVGQAPAEIFHRFRSCSIYCGCRCVLCVNLWLALKVHRDMVVRKNICVQLWRFRCSCVLLCARCLCYVVHVGKRTFVGAVTTRLMLGQGKSQRDCYCALLLDLFVHVQDGMYSVERVLEGHGDLPVFARRRSGNRFRVLADCSPRACVVEASETKNI